MGDWETAVELLFASDAILDARDVVLYESDIAPRRALLDAATAELGEPRIAQARADARSLDPADAMTLARQLLTAGVVSADG